jgi:translation initiation factor 2 alpha subunit (eIF-2alpha)
VFQAIQEFLKKYEINVLVFASLNNVDKRMKLYNRIIALYSSKFGVMIPNIKTSSGVEVTVLVSHKVPKDQIDEFKEYVKDQMKFK